MAQLNFTLEQEFFVGLFSKGREEAFGELMEALLNQFLQAESAQKLQAEEYERCSERTDYRNGTRARTLTTRVGSLTLNVPRHRNEVFHSSLLENYQRNEQALIATMMEMVVQGVSTRKIEKVTEELCGAKFSKSTVSELCKGLNKSVFEFKNRPLEKSYPFLMLDALYIKVREDFRVRSKAFLVAFGINEDGRKEILGFDVCENETEYHWESFLRNLKERGLKDVDLAISDGNPGLISAIRKELPKAGWQRCQVHFTRNILGAAPKRYQNGLAEELREMFLATTVEEAREKRNKIIEEYQDVAAKAVNILDEGFEDSMNVMCLPLKYRIKLRTTNLLERENRELRRREMVISIFPNVDSALRLMGAVLLDHHNEWPTQSRIFNMEEYYQKREKLLPLLRAA